MSTNTRVEKSFCRLCWSRCALNVTIENGKVVSVAHDKEFSERVSTPCVKGMALPEILNHPQRLLYPLKRTGAKGEGKWAQITWDEALGIIADKMNTFKAESGAESVAIGLPSPRGLEMVFAQRLASVFGTPNVAPPSYVCHVPRIIASILTYGAHSNPDNENLSACLMVWGSNLMQTRGSSISLDQLPAALKKTKLIVIDPQKTGLAARANIWLKLRPGTDGALALAMLKVIIEEELYDKQFVTDWTVGFPELKEHVGKYSLDKLSEMTWVPVEQIQKTARMYATISPAAVDWGNSLDTNINTIQTCRAIAMLSAITGNLDVPGGNVLTEAVPLMKPLDLMLLKEFPRNIDKALGKEFKLSINFNFISRQALINSIADGKPYKVRGALMLGTNPLLTYANARKTYQALNNLEFMAVADLFMTPTTELADIVLPVAYVFEMDEIGPFPSINGFTTASPKLVEPPGECWSDLKIINELGKKLGYVEQFFANEVAALDAITAPAGMTFDDFKRKRTLTERKQYRKYEKGGFKTKSGKVELYSQSLKNMGYSPLPVYVDTFENASSDYPLTLTSAKSAYFVHSASRQAASLRKIAPEPTVELNPQTAKNLGLKNGDLACIETKVGAIKQKVKLNQDLDPRVVIAGYGWWFPEKGQSEMYGWDEANINILTDSEPPYDPTLGSVNLRGIPCKVYKAE